MDEHSGDLEAERVRLAAQLQRALIDPLNLLLAQAQVYEQTFATQPAARTAIGVMATLARQVLQQALDLDADLKSAGLAELGLEGALELLAGRVMRAHGMRIVLALPLARTRLNPAIELALFRLCQDSLARSALALARQVSLSLQREPDRFGLEISDDGDPVVATASLQPALLRLERSGVTHTIGVSPHGGLVLSCQLTLAPAVTLTDREREILRLLSEGLANKAIAARLQLSPRTINFHLDNLYHKLGVRSRTEAVIQAMRLKDL